MDCVIPVVPVAVGEHPTVPFAYKRASRAFRTAAICPVCEQMRQAFEVLFDNRTDSREPALDRFWLRAQDHSYTNDKSVVADEPHPMLTGRLLHDD